MFSPSCAINTYTLKLPCFISGYPPDKQAYFRERLSKCTHVGVSEAGSIYVQAPEFLAIFLKTVLSLFDKVCATSNATPA